MGEYHKVYPVNTLKDEFFALFTHIQNVANDVVSLVYDSVDGNWAVWIDPTGTGAAASAWWDGVTVLTANHFGQNSFLVVEVNFANPGGRKWQAKILGGSTVNVYVEGSPNGGFSTATNSFGGNPTTGSLQTQNVLPAAGDEVYISVSDLDTYDAGTKKYGYLRFLLKDATGGPSATGFYVGGYCPSDVVNDTDPFVMLYNSPRIVANVTAGTWGYSGGTVGSISARAPVEDGLAVTDLSGSYAYISGSYPVTALSHSQTRAGVEVEFQITIHQHVGHLLGYFGPYTMRAVSAAVGSFQINNAGTRLAIYDIAHRWVP